VLVVVALTQGVDAIISFAVPMLFGSISGCYSSVALSAPIWMRWLKKEEAAEA
jgi:preprotein translocase subunit SecF